MSPWISIAGFLTFSSVRGPRCCARGDLRNNKGVKIADAPERVARSLLLEGPATAAELGIRLGVSGTVVRRHLDHLEADEVVVASETPPFGPRRVRGRGRPARVYSLTDSGRQVFEQSYDDLAASALRYVLELGGEEAIATFAQRRAADFEARYRAQENVTTSQRVEALASALSRDGYAASTVRAAEGSDGVQLCQHHCPVSHVAAEFPQLCEAETVAFGRILGTHVQRLATIAHGDGVCTTHVPTLGRDDSLVLAGRMSNDSH